ncbi:MAG TPA: DJ-1/PfpI family protein [Sporichthyaceae bacterium]|nr:DJ-1/PfpI family protein [Sporichthyaceae bacterium]
MVNTRPTAVGLVFYPGMTALDVVGPQAVFSVLADVTIHRIWKTLDPIQSDDGMTVVPDTTFANCPPLDVVCIGGGTKQGAIQDDPELLDFLAKQGATAQYVTSVCGGSVMLAKAGLLEGYRATTHWAMHDQLAELGASVTAGRVVVDRNRMTGGGVTAGIDFGLTIAAALRGEEAAKMAQLIIEYDPAPPFDAGSPEKAGPELVEKTIAWVMAEMADDAVA